MQPIIPARMLLASCIVLCVAVLPDNVVLGQEWNFGKKVKCYIEAGTVVCPGCNTRAGLLCPRRTNAESCSAKPESPSTRNPIATDDEPTSSPATTYTWNRTNTSPFDEIPREEIEYWAKKARENPQFRLFLYRILFSQTHLAPRWKRDADPQQRGIEEEERCEWNGDCPCPLICCDQGEGCPKICVKGIRLPPPWG